MRWTSSLDRLLREPRRAGGGPQRKRDIVKHRHVRVEGVTLERHSDVALPRIQLGDVIVVEIDLPVVRGLEASNETQRRRLAGTGRAKKDEEFAVFDGQVRGFRPPRFSRSACSLRAALPSPFPLLGLLQQRPRHAASDRPVPSRRHARVRAAPAARPDRRLWPARWHRRRTRGTGRPRARRRSARPPDSRRD